MAKLTIRQQNAMLEAIRQIRELEVAKREVTKAIGEQQQIIKDMRRANKWRYWSWENIRFVTRLSPPADLTVLHSRKPMQSCMHSIPFHPPANAFPFREVSDMTDEQWKQVESRLSRPFGSVKMQIDGYKITVVVEPLKGMKLVLMVYVDGYFRGKWLTEDCDIRRRFYYCSKRSLLTTKEKKRLQREKKAIREEIQKKMEYMTFLPYFGSFRTLKSHFMKNNQSIELCEGAGE